ncbi:MAG: ATP-grasp domain-containing protein [Deltaproteobacteria bacterium]|nr:ATP-grasp domain-containing protein [Deltaproteobacteria bacterium]
MRVGLTYNLKKTVADGEDLPPDFYAECDDPETIEDVRVALLARHEEVVMIEADEDAFEKLRKTRPQIVFNMAEGVWGSDRESQMPAIMEMLRIPYTGSSPLTLGLCLNKARAKESLEHHGVPTAGFFLVESAPFEIPAGLRFPMMVKPVFEGSSKGIRNNSIVEDRSELEERVEGVLAEYKQPALVEEFLPGREFTVSVLGNGASMRALPIVEINYSSLPQGIRPIYSYEAKWILDTPDAPLDIFACPAPLDDALREAIEDVVLRSCRALGVRDWCRVDVRLDAGGAPNVIELNPLPGILMDPKCNSCFPKAARTAGMTYAGLINSVVDIARQRYGL